MRPFLEKKLKEAEAAATFFAQLGAFGVARQVLGAVDYMRTPDGEKYVTVGNDPMGLEQMHAGFMQMCWWFGVAPTGSHFVASDSPVVFSAVHGLHNSPLIVPIGRDIVLLASWNELGDLRFVEFSAAQVDAINGIVVSVARKEVYASVPDAAICAGFGAREETDA